MEWNDLNALEAQPWGKSTKPGVLTMEGHRFENVGVRHRGEWARSWPKKPFKFILKPDDASEGHHSFNLNSAWRDPAFIRELLAYHVYAACGVAAPEARMVRLNVNGSFMGLYVQVEQPDKAFLKRVGLKGLHLFKTSSPSNQADERDLGSERAFAANYTRENHTPGTLTDLRNFCHEMAVTKEVGAFFTNRVETEAYINYLAATALIQHWDGYNKNHLLGFDPNAQRWRVIPWDLDRTFGDVWTESFRESRLSALLGTRRQPGVTGWNRMFDRFLSHPDLRKRYLNRLEELLETEFTPTKLNPVIDGWAAHIAQDASLDRKRWPSMAGGLKPGIEQLKRWIVERREFLKREIAQLR